MFPEDRKNTVPAKRRQTGMITLTGTEEEMTAIEERIIELVEENYAADIDKIKKMSRWYAHLDKMVLVHQNNTKNEQQRLALARTSKNDDGILGRRLEDDFSMAESHQKGIQTELTGLRAVLSSKQSKARGLREVTGLG